MSQSAQVLIDREVLEAMVQSSVELSNELQRLPFPQNTAAIKASCVADTLRSFLVEPQGITGAEFQKIFGNVSPEAGRELSQALEMAGVIKGDAVEEEELQPNDVEQLRSGIVAEIRAEAGHLPGAPHGLAKRLNNLADRLAALPICEVERALAISEEFKAKAARYDKINTPEIADFLRAVENEALHQRDRWASEHDAGKTDTDWFWLIGHLAGKAILKPEKALHHIITTAAACLNWHAHKTGASTLMRPGIGPDAQPPKPSVPQG